MNDTVAKIAALQEEIEQLKRQWPAHSVSPALLQRLDELEEQLAEAIAELHQDEKLG
jgi:cell division protein ZapA (FtsZ GTPase activity inhibitor)